MAVVGLTRRGDDEFVEFARANSARLQRAAYLLTGNRHQAEDAAQAALVKVYAAWGRVRRKDPYAYARTVLANLITDQWRRPMREYATEQLPEQPLPRDLADDVTRRRWLIGALKTLSPRERTVVVLRHFFDATEVDVARELNLSLGTVKSLNSRALAKLRVSVPSPRRAESGVRP
ncbi:SigE family RNA polymerase sigma factor [Actinoplanes friuliensis]|jgi:RNA polymerase sigma-70 factor (sigma-E family)|uniref:Putative RNA polymerase ECF-subfamily sigma factor n=1 Tax=Actinoplanes friuliensis DSM 7358 TaxID=1246995 RepID=U5W6B2_9ACTN|nr:SigE family RNA polymerase sigma factor [Actinoplanes friuliensis]AGZ44733.1 putative RNA polymerase ECF-subfamily sigma factor [Actinoplanes friuliensis DSM 7358]